MGETDDEELDLSELTLDWREDLDLTVQLLVLGFVTLRFGTVTWRAAAPGSWIDGIAVWSLFVTGFGLGSLGVVEVDIKRWGRHIAGLTLLAYLLGALSMADRLPALGTDALMFSAAAADALLAGANPYTVNMQASFVYPGAAYDVSTAIVDGSMAKWFSYPAGSLFLFAPARLLDIQLRYVVLAAVAAAGVLLITVSPPEWALAGLGSMIIARNFFTGSLGGITDPLWMAPTLLAMVLWYSDRWTAAALVLGVAAGIKQHPWLITPFLAVWVWMVSDSLSAFGRRAARLIGVGLLGFLALNLPFILADPVAWLRGALTPIRGPLVPLGSGLALLHRLGLYPVATWWHTLAMGLFGGWVLLWYAHAFERVKWLGWILPAAVLFLSYRSLITYFVTWMPLLWMAVVANSGRLDATLPRLLRSPTTAPGWGLSSGPGDRR